jgi:hypothetical protein
LDKKNKCNKIIKDEIEKLINQEKDKTPKKSNQINEDQIRYKK